ncbi:hypothetical protein V6N13_147969 [Hibiscus sabdariffa]
MTVTLFVRNIPPALYWSGLRHVFGRHGDITDQFILNKLDKAGKRFGFVRFSNKTDANRAIKRLNGFSLFGYRLSVSLSRYGGTSTYWRKVDPRRCRNSFLRKDIPTHSSAKDQAFLSGCTSNS